VEAPITAAPVQPLVDAVLPCDRASPAAARHLVDASLHDRGLDDVRDEASLLVSEVVTNAVRHAGSGVAVHVDLVDETVRVTVTDHGPGWPQRREATVGGWGLNLVQTIATRWGAFAATDGKTVWFELPA
jgi:anti-sigma regulatory factor (Ser/Thr protein kinase)